MMNIKVQVGQIWSHPEHRYPYQITSIRDNMAYAVRVGFSATESSFGHLNPDTDTPRRWERNWSCTSLTAEEKVKMEAEAFDQQRRLEYAMRYL